MLWFIIFGCFIKVFVQIELGRFAVSRGMTTLEAMNSIPGPRLIVSWLVWLWVFMYFALIFQVAGMVGELATVFDLAGVNLPVKTIAAGVGLLTAVLLVVGRYKWSETGSTAMVAIFTLCTLVAVGAFKRRPTRSPAQILPKDLNSNCRPTSPTLLPRLASSVSVRRS